MRIEQRVPCQLTPLSGQFPAILDRLFRNRGVDDSAEVSLVTKDLAHFSQLLNSEKAASVIFGCMQQNQRICIVGDFDADGATSTALCKLAFEMFGYFNVEYLVPNRFDFGYGLSPEIVHVAHEKGAQLLITVDNGIACLEGVDTANNLGMQVVITDHHLPADSLPNAAVIVNPNQHECQFPSKNLAGVGVAFYVMAALRVKLSQERWFESHNLPTPNLASLLDIVAVGTVADVVPLDKNNRILIHQGLQRIRSGHTKPGIKAIIEVAGRDLAQIGASDLGFVVGPRLNAAGRLDDMSMGIETLLAKDSMQARHMAARLDGLNQERKEIEASMQSQAAQALQALSLNTDDLPDGLVIYKDDFHQGVIGIVAGRIKEKHNRPSIVFAKDGESLLKGSARSIKGVHIRDVLDQINTQHPNIILKFGGHAMAAGLTIELANIETFTALFARYANIAMANLPKELSIFSDGSLGLDDISLDTARLLKLNVPWGQQFEEPIFDGEFELVSQRIVGKKHLKMIVRYFGVEFDAIAFNVDTQVWPNTHVQKLHLVYKLDINAFRDRLSVQLLVEYFTEC